MLSNGDCNFFLFKPSSFLTFIVYMTFSQEDMNLDMFKYNLDIINLNLLVPTSIEDLKFKTHHLQLT